MNNLNKCAFLVALVLTAGTLFLFPGCSKKNERQTLIISTWGVSEDMLWRDVYEPFEKAFNVTIVLETGSTAERYTRLETNPNSTIDIIELSQKAAADGYAANIFAKLDYSKIPNAQYLIPAAKAMTADNYGPAYTVNSIGIIYNPDAVDFEITEWADLWRSELVNRISIPDITTTFGPAMVYVAADFAQTPIASDNGAAAFGALAELNRNVVKTYTRSPDLANMFVSGEIVAAVVGDFGVPVISNAMPGIRYIVPASGTYANFNTINIAANSRNKEIAHAYINWRLDRDVQSRTVVSINEAPTNTQVVLTAEQSRNITYGPVAERARAVDYALINPLMEQWINMWNRTMNR